SRRTAMSTADGSSSWWPAGRPGIGSGVGTRRTCAIDSWSVSSTAPLNDVVPRSMPRKRITVYHSLGAFPLYGGRHGRETFPRALAVAPTGRMAIHVRDSSPLDPDRRQGSARPDALDQPLLE